MPDNTQNTANTAGGGNAVPRITGLLLLEVRKSNPNGDPEREGAPRQRTDGFGEISPVSVKRKLRDLVEDKNGVVWQEVANGHVATSFDILESRGRDRNEIKRLTPDAFAKRFWDARLFGNTFLEEEAGSSIRTGVVHFGVGVSLAPIEIELSTWTNKAGVQDGKDRGMAPLAFKVVRHTLYAVPFFVNPNFAHKTGCAKQDVELFLKLLKYAYTNTPSVIRTQVNVIHAHTFTHNSRAGSLPDYLFLDALTPAKLEKPSESLADYKDLAEKQWDKIKDKSIREGAPQKFGALGTYQDYAL
ncbi:MAG: type I CRISPR-associated protein Cas7 [Puniceicoccales bacterium]|jgi:Cas7 group CRISPR-associated protein Csh2|nr:type I CRISPR-associated protein Cas7 [Puniceicoccales bacterium]